MMTFVSPVNITEWGVCLFVCLFVCLGSFCLCLFAFCLLRERERTFGGSYLMGHWFPCAGSQTTWTMLSNHTVFLTGLKKWLTGTLGKFNCHAQIKKSPIAFNWPQNYELGAAPSCHTQSGQTALVSQEPSIDRTQEHSSNSIFTKRHAKLPVLTVWNWMT